MAWLSASVTGGIPREPVELVVKVVPAVKAARLVKVARLVKAVLVVRVARLAKVVLAAKPVPVVKPGLQAKVELVAAEASPSIPPPVMILARPLAAHATFQIARTHHWVGSVYLDFLPYVDGVRARSLF